MGYGSWMDGMGLVIKDYDLRYLEDARGGEDREGVCLTKCLGERSPLGTPVRKEERERREDLQKAMGKIRTEKERERGGKWD